MRFGYFYWSWSIIQVLSKFNCSLNMEISKQFLYKLFILFVNIIVFKLKGKINLWKYFVPEYIIQFNVNKFHSCICNLIDVIITNFLENYYGKFWFMVWTYIGRYILYSWNCCPGYINTLLSCRLLHPLSRLTYCAYLIHPVLMASVGFQLDGPLHLHNTLVVSIQKRVVKLWKYSWGLRG